MATPLSEDGGAEWGAEAAPGTSRDDDQRHVQRTRACIHDIKSSNADGSTKASLMEMVVEGDSPPFWRLRAPPCSAIFRWVIWSMSSESWWRNGFRVVQASTAEGPAAASARAAALLGARERLDWARQLNMICGTTTVSFGRRSEPRGAAFGRDLCCSMRTHNCSVRARAAAWAGARRCVQTQAPSRQSLVLGHK